MEAAALLHRMVMKLRFKQLLKHVNIARQANPEIHNISPKDGFAGTRITIHGINLGADSHKAVVFVGSTNCGQVEFLERHRAVACNFPGGSVCNITFPVSVVIDGLEASQTTPLTFTFKKERIATAALMTGRRPAFADALSTRAPEKDLRTRFIEVALRYKLAESNKSTHKKGTDTDPRGKPWVVDERLWRKIYKEYSDIHKEMASVSTSTEKTLLKEDAVKVWVELKAKRGL